MSAQVFVDTNILIYAGFAHPDDAAKRAVALRILHRTDVGFSAQVMKDYYDVAYRKKRLALSQQEAVAALRALALRPIAPIAAELVLRAAALSDRFRISPLRRRHHPLESTRAPPAAPPPRSTTTSASHSSTRPYPPKRLANPINPQPGHDKSENDASRAYAKSSENPGHGPAPSPSTRQNALFHSDRGVQYASAQYRHALVQAGLVASMSRRGNCYDNAAMESFWATLKLELVYRTRFATRDDARGPSLRLHRNLL